LPRPPATIKEDSTTGTSAKGGGQKQQSVEERVAALSTYCMAKGLCKRCGEKWHRGHKCAVAVQLNALQEIWDILEPEDADQDTHSDTEHTCMAISAAALAGTEAPKTAHQGHDSEHGNSSPH
jgi:hypothetical protein